MVEMTDMLPRKKLKESTPLNIDKKNKTNITPTPKKGKAVNKNKKLPSKCTAT